MHEDLFGISRRVLSGSESQSECIKNRFYFVGERKETDMDDWIALIVLVALAAFIYFYFSFSFRSNAKQMVSIFDALFIIVDKCGDSSDKDAYNVLVGRYRDKDGKLIQVNATTLYQLRRDAKFFIAEHFADKEFAMKMYKTSILDIIEK
jgi:hypothetical protein